MLLTVDKQTIFTIPIHVQKITLEGRYPSSFRYPSLISFTSEVFLLNTLSLSPKFFFQWLLFLHKWPLLDDLVIEVCVYTLMVSHTPEEKYHILTDQVFEQARGHHRSMRWCDLETFVSQQSWSLSLNWLWHHCAETTFSPYQHLSSEVLDSKKLQSMLI